MVSAAAASPWLKQQQFHYVATTTTQLQPIERPLPRTQLQALAFRCLPAASSAFLRRFPPPACSGRSWNLGRCSRGKQLRRIRPLVTVVVSSSRHPRDVSDRDVDDEAAEIPAKGFTVSEELESPSPPPTGGLPPGGQTFDQPLYLVEEMSSMDLQATCKPKSDLLKAATLSILLLGGAAILNHSWVAENKNLAMVGIFALGYMGIVFEEFVGFNKSAVAILMAVPLWVILGLEAPSIDEPATQLKETVAEVSEIVYFLMGAMTIVETIDAHQGFKLVTDSITTRKPRLLLWVVGAITFFLSAVLDNLTSTIVMVSLLRKLISNPEQRRFLGAVVVIAANSGGAWTPIGDVTTTMLWIHGQISTLRTIQDLLLPSMVSLVVPLALMSLSSEAASDKQLMQPALTSEPLAPKGRLVFGVGVGALLFVPIFKALTGLPPYLGILLGLATLWLLTDAIHYGEPDRQNLKVPHALSRIDTQGVLFFLGTLLSVGSLQSAGILTDLATYLNSHIPNVELIAMAIGLASAVIDNVPLVAATMGMYNLSSFPVDAEIWQLIAYCAGTGGSILIIGSAAGVAYMGMEEANFFWYMGKVSGFALAGYVAGIGMYLAANQLWW